jgi:hypothetical protein
VQGPVLQPQSFKTKTQTSECWLLTPVILAIQEAAIRRITVQSQPEKIFGETLSQNNPIQNRTGEVAQSVGLSSNPNTAKKKKEEEKESFLIPVCPLQPSKHSPNMSFPFHVLAQLLYSQVDPCRDPHQGPGPSNSILSKPIRSVQTYFSPYPKEIKTLPGVFILNYRTCRDPARPLPTHLPTHCLTPFPHMAFKLAVQMPKYSPLYSQGSSSLSSEVSLPISSCYTLIFWPPYCNCLQSMFCYLCISQGSLQETGPTECICNDKRGFIKLPYATRVWRVPQWLSAD